MQEIYIWYLAISNALKHVNEYVKNEMMNSFTIENSDNISILDQNPYSLSNRLLACKNTNALENFFVALTNFYQTLPNSNYACITHAYTLFLLKKLAKENNISYLEYHPISKLNILSQQENFGQKGHIEEIQMYYITFKKDRNLEDIDRKWLTLFLENMHFNHIKIENNLNNTLVLKLLINFKIDKKRLKMFYSICKNILEEMQNSSGDVYETSIHYYKILKKCQIMLK